MSGNPYEKAASGKRLNIPAPAWNTLMDVAQEYNASGINGGGIGAGIQRFSSLILVQNNSGSLVGQFGVLGIDTIAISPTDNPESHKNQVFLSGVTPTTASHTGKFVVVAEPIEDEQIGKVFASGVFPAKVYMTTGSETFADVKNSDATQLQGGTTGAAQILWVESGTGSKWAVVRMGNAGAGTIASPATLGLSTEGTETAATDSWTQNGTTGTYNAVPLELWATCRVVYNHAGDKKLYAFQRKLTIDSAGRVRLVSAETRVEVDATGLCP